LYRRITHRLQEKLSEALKAVLPVMFIVILLSFTIAPIPTGIMMAFLTGGALLIIGMMFFTLGAELAMEPMGEKLGTQITKTKRLWLIILLGFLLGFVITISEPDLQVLANQVPAIPNMTLILAVAIGVGIFLAVAILRMLFSVPLPHMLIGFYLLVFALAVFVPENFLAVAFDSGGVTTGPMTVPFIMAFGIGISSIRSDRHASDDSFGLVALCSIGPIIAVLLLGLIYKPADASYVAYVMPEIDHSVTLANMFVHEIPEYMKEISIALAPIIAFFAVFLMFGLKLEKRTLLRICVGVLFTYIGLVTFLTGVNVGFMPAGNYLGQTIAALEYKYIIVPIGMVIGYFIVMAEPAVYVLMKQVEEITDGAISGNALKTSLSISVAVSIGFAMLRVLTGISIFYFVIPGYFVALVLAFFVPKLFTAIAFDSGGVASGPMTATFLLPFAMGACNAVGGNVITDAFGVVAMVAMTPLITIQVLGLIYKIKSSRHTDEKAVPDSTLAAIGDYDIIDL